MNEYSQKNELSSYVRKSLTKLNKISYSNCSENES